MGSANLPRRPWSLLIGLCLALAAGGALAAQTCKYDSIPATAPASRFTDNGDGTVTDKATGLQWKRCSEGQTWDGATCTGSPTAHNWQQALLLADGASYAGKDDWRLPNLKELQSIVESACYQPAIDVGAFPGTPSNSFWSSSPGANYAGVAWVVYFNYGGVSYYGKDDDGQVRLVRGGQALSFVNDTGLDWWADGATNFLPSPPAAYPGQDASFGRDATQDNDADGHAGFSFTKLDANGNALAASAAAWSCVRDNVTGLIWEVKTDDGGLRDKDWQYTWYNPDPSTNGGSVGTPDGTDNCHDPARCDTAKFAADVNAGGLCGAGDWRLPTLEELHSIVDLSRYGPAIDRVYFPEIADYWLYWSSSPFASPFASDAGNAWVVYFGNGYDGGNYKDADGLVRLVRGGQVLPSDPASFAFAPIASPQAEGEPFAVAITALDAQGQPLPWSGAAQLSSAAVTINPTSVSFVNGAWSGLVTVFGSATGVTLDAKAAGVTSTSAPFTVTPKFCWECLPSRGGWRAILQ